MNKHLFSLQKRCPSFSCYKTNIWDTGHNPSGGS
ncbi:Sacm1l [Phodopus roborovskii]|uniref:Sacm1l protein n=1 Tax=Phodopus roborovskii TaxID=109678 RepID=A0AAU9YS57_PHORO|nr:Sacm1l [Phodopus roborovskii]